ncbi:MAG: hypothetical protein GY724_20800 [Actinomycetia bacterium]|nr:hypothetical protein [Actinomycetes bacterium]MCP4224468.1 hypothetical protein [Actinomycetes bacterium]MCP5032458.1 hypothetical protein [Actinomycetes bacterium]
MRARWLGIVSLSALLLGCGVDQGAWGGEPESAETTHEALSFVDTGDDAPGATAVAATRTTTVELSQEPTPTSISPSTSMSPSTTAQSTTTAPPSTTAPLSTTGEPAASAHDHELFGPDQLAELERALDEIDQLLTDLELDLGAD